MTLHLLWTFCIHTMLDPFSVIREPSRPQSLVIRSLQGPRLEDSSSSERHPGPSLPTTSRPVLTRPSPSSYSGPVSLRVSSDRQTPRPHTETPSSSPLLRPFPLVLLLDFLQLLVQFIKSKRGDPLSLGSFRKFVFSRLYHYYYTY